MKYFGKEVVLQKPAEVCYKLYNQDGSLWGDSWGGLEYIKLGRRYYAVHRGWGLTFELIAPNGERLGTWHELFVGEVEVKQEKGPISLNRAMIFLGIKPRPEPQKVQVMFGTLGSRTEPIPQELLDRALWSLNPADFPTVPCLGGLGRGGRGGTGTARAYAPARRPLGKRP